jgi:hypothetical protein
MSSNNKNNAARAPQGADTRWIVVGCLMAAAFFASFAWAQASRTPAQQAFAAGQQATAIPLATTAGNPGSGGAGGGGCCGTGGSGAAGATGGTGAAAAPGGGGCCGGNKNVPASAKVPKAAVVSGGIQKISVDLSKGYYDPSVIQLKAGVPAEITFGQASGCTGTVQSQQLGFSEDLSGGPKTVKLGALQPGQYTFACGMNMVTGTITVK